VNPQQVTREEVQEIVNAREIANAMFPDLAPWHSYHSLLNGKLDAVLEAAWKYFELHPEPVTYHPPESFTDEERVEMRKKLFRT
jgi:hypothetical protein